MRTLSVISTQRREGSTPVWRTHARTASSNSGRASCTADTLTETLKSSNSRSPARPTQSAAIPAGFQQDPLPDGNDQVVLLGDRYPVGRRQGSPVGMVPPGQGLYAYEPAVRNPELRLVFEPELLPADGPA